MKDSKIAWTHHTFNPWIGCTKVSPACDNCYAEARSNRFGDVEWGAGKPRRRTSENNWRQPLRWDRKAEQLGVRYRVFCASLADVFDTEVPNIWRADLFQLIWATPHLDWLLLTKRPHVAGAHYTNQAWPSNIWIGTTVESMDVLEARWKHIAMIPRVRFLSCEPLLGPVSLLGLDPMIVPDWVIVGGESGANARTMDPRWAMLLKGDCDHLGIRFFMKQMSGRKRADLDAIPPELALREYPTQGDQP